MPLVTELLSFSAVQPSGADHDLHRSAHISPGADQSGGGGGEPQFGCNFHTVTPIAAPACWRCCWWFAPVHQCVRRSAASVARDRYEARPVHGQFRGVQCRVALEGRLGAQNVWIR